MKEEQEFLQQANKLVARWPPIMKEALGQEIYDQILQKTKAALIKIKKSTDPTYIHVALHATDLIKISESDITLDEMDARTFASALAYIAAYELDNEKS